MTPKCFKCGAEIDYLDNIESGEKVYRMTLCSHGMAHYEEEDDSFFPDGQVNHWECPECNRPLFDDEGEAVEFLKGKPTVSEFEEKQFQKYMSPEFDDLYKASHDHRNRKQWAKDKAYDDALNMEELI